MKSTTVFLLFLIQAISVTAQTLRDFDIQEMAEQQIPIFVDHPNEAAVVFYTAISNLTVESKTGGVVAIRKEATKLTVFLRPERQILTLKAPGFIEKKQSMSGLTAKQALFYRVNERENSYTTEKGSFLVHTVPDGALLKIEGLSDFKKFTPYELIDYKTGKYRFYITKPDYYPLDTLIEIRSGIKQSGVFELRSMYGTVSIRASQKVKVTLNNRVVEVGTDFISERLPVGDYSIVVNDPRFFPVSEKIVVESGKTKLVDIPLRSVFGTLSLKAPMQVSVQVSDNLEQVGPEGKTVQLKVGSYPVMVSDYRFEPYLSTVTIQSGQLTTLVLQLVKKAGYLQIIHPEAFTLTINGETKEKKPGPVMMEFFEGSYKAEVKRPGYQSVTFSFNILKGEVLNWEPIFTPVTVIVKLNTEPAGASVIVQRGTDQEALGFTPLEESIAVGAVEFIVKREGFKDFQFKTTLEEGKPFTRLVNLADPTASDYKVVNGVKTGKLTYNGFTYTTVIIGTQEWTVENLRATTYNDGTAIPKVTDDNTWSSLSTGAYCAYNNDETNVTTYGYLYNWYTVNIGKLAPTTGGWRVPTDADWTKLTDYLGGEDESGTKLKAKTGWNSNGNGTDSYGFSALPCGSRYYLDGAFGNLGFYGSWWSSSADDTSNAWFRSLVSNDASVYRFSSRQRLGFSVRFVRDL